MKHNKAKPDKGFFDKIIAIDLFSKTIELTYNGSVYNDTVFGAVTTILLVVMIMSVGLNDFIKVSEKHVTTINREKNWLDVDTNSLNMTEVGFNLAFGFPGEDLKP